MSLLLWFYPRRWRERYGDEVGALLTSEAPLLFADNSLGGGALLADVAVMLVAAVVAGIALVRARPRRPTRAVMRVA